MINFSELQFDEQSLSSAIASVDLTKLERTTCEEYALAFGRQIERAPELAAPLQFLAIVCGWRLRCDNGETRFEFVWTPTADEVTEGQLATVANVAPTVADCELRARLADLVWTRLRNHQLARIACTDYLNSVERLIQQGNILGEKVRLMRAVQLASMLGSSGPLLTETIPRLTAIAQTPDLPHCTLADCLRALLTCRQSDHALLHGFAVRRAQAIAADTPNPLWERGFWDIAAELASRMKDDSLHRAAAIAAAQTFEREAEKAPMQAVAAHFWEMALHRYRNISGTETDRERVHQCMLLAQKTIPKEMFTAAEESVDISELVTQSRQRIRGKGKQQAIAQLVYASRWLEKAKVQADAEESIRSFPLQNLFSTVRFSSTWKVAATASGTAPSDDIAQDRLHAVMCDQYRFFIPIATSGAIEPMRYELSCAHAVSIDDVAEFVHNSPIVPAGRDAFFVVGLYAGLQGRFIESLHVLVPQLEHLLRCGLADHNVITSGIDHNGIQGEFDLNRLLSMPETESLLGPDLQFALRLIFTDRHGYNLRNELAHGMLTSHFFFSEVAVYAWWLVLRIIGGSFAQVLLQNASPDVDQGEGDSQAPASNNQE